MDGKKNTSNLFIDLFAYAVMVKWPQYTAMVSYFWSQWDLHLEAIMYVVHFAT